jgi:hypothetical protein
MTRSRLALSDSALLGILPLFAPLIGRAWEAGGSNARLKKFSAKNH